MASDVERIKEKLPIEEVIGAYVKLDNSAGRLKGRCPFHGEKTPSFFVSPERGSYYCFGCQAKGDIFTFVQEFERLDFRGALKVLAERAGIELVHEAPAKRDEKVTLYELLEKATLYFQKQLAERKDVIKYLTDRGMTIATIKAWRIGFAPDEWKSASTALVGKGFTPAMIEKAGLTKKSEKNEHDHYDRFRSRIMFPLTDTSGRVVGFSGRIFGNDAEAAKYLNSPETELFDKSSFLYGFDKAKFAIRKSDTTVLVEGQMDLIMSHQAGVDNAVAVSGTALTEKHVDMLKRFSHNLLLAFDADTAGQRASERATATALSKGLEVKVITIHGGKDPADLVKDNPELWRAAVSRPVHVIEYQLMQAMRETESRPRAKLVEEIVLPYVAALPSPIEQSHFLSKISLEAGIPIKALEDTLKRIPVLDVIQRDAPVPEAIVRLRVDMIERKLAALLVWLGNTKNVRPDMSKEVISDYVTAHIGKEVLTQLEKLAHDHASDLAFEAEASFAQATSLRAEVDQILHGFHEEHLKKRLAEAMMALKQAEGGKHVKEAERQLQICQDISNQLHKLKNH